MKKFSMVVAVLSVMVIGFTTVVISVAMAKTSEKEADATEVKKVAVIQRAPKTASEAALVAALNTFTAGDMADFSNCFSSSQIMSHFPSDTMALALGTDQATAKAFVNAWCTNAEYNVISVTEADDTAQVVLEVKGADMLGMLNTAKAKYEDLAVQGSGEYAGMSREELSQKAFDEVLSSKDVRLCDSQKVVVSLSKVGGKWMIDDDAALIGPLFPGYLS